MNNYIKVINDLRNYEVETEWFEFKENFSDPDKIGEYISALSNAAAYHRKDFAYMVWGIHDLTHEITGTTFNYRKNVKGEPLEHYLARLINPDIAFSFHEIFIKDKRIIMLEIPKSKNTPTSFKEVRYLRIGSSKVLLSRYPDREAKLFEILSDKKNTIIDIESRYQDLTFEKLFTYFAGRGITLKENTFKKNLNLLTKDGKYNLMAQLLSDDSRISIRVSIFEGINKASNLYSVRDFGNTCLLVSLDKVLEYIDVVNIIQADERDRVVSRKEVPFFDKDAVREAIINSFVHNKWVEENAPMFTIYKDRLEILSRGKLDDRQTMEGFFEGESIPVNKELSDIFLQLHISERSGRGVPKIVDKYGRSSFDFRENSIAVNIKLNRIYVSVTTHSHETVTISDTKNDMVLNDRRKNILSEIEKNPYITYDQLSDFFGISITSIGNNIKYLKENGFIERIGSNKSGHWKVNK